MSEVEFIKLTLVVFIFVFLFVGAVMGFIFKGILFSALLCLIGVIFIPNAERNEVYKSVASQSDLAYFTVDAYAKCRNPGMFQSRGDAECQVETLKLVTELKGSEYELQSREFLSQISERLKNEIK